MRCSNFLQRLFCRVIFVSTWRNGYSETNKETNIEQKQFLALFHLPFVSPLQRLRQTPRWCRQYYESLNSFDGISFSKYNAFYASTLNINALILEIDK